MCQFFPHADIYWMLHMDVEMWLSGLILDIRCVCVCVYVYVHVCVCVCNGSYLEFTV